MDNLSFHVYRGNKRVATVPLAVQADGIARWAPLVTNYGGIPARIHLSHDCDNPGKTIHAILAYLPFLMRSYGVKETLLQEPLSEQMLLYKLLSRDHLFSAELWDRPVVYLSQSEDRIYSSVRSSYKSLINWGRTNLQMEYHTGPDLDDARIRSIHQIVQRCHQKVVDQRGDNMTPASFALAMATCRIGKGEVAVAKTRDGDACGITVTTDDAGVAFYSLGGQIELGNKSPGNFIVYDSIIRAKRRGMTRYHPNTLAPAPIRWEGQTRVELANWQMSNFFFKRGFSDDLEVAHVYRVLPKGVSVA